MQHDFKTYLFNIERASNYLVAFSLEKEWSDYQNDPLLRSAVERQFEIIGEALSQLAARYPEIVEEISEHKKIIAFRNILIHGYAKVDNKVVWDVLKNKLPVLRNEVRELLKKQPHS